MEVWVSKVQMGVTEVEVRDIKVEVSIIEVTTGVTMDGDYLLMFR